MGTELYYNDAATWRKAKEFYYNDGGTWRKAKECWYNDGGTWRKVFSGTPAGSEFTLTGATSGALTGYIRSAFGSLSPTTYGSINVETIVQVTTMLQFQMQTYTDLGASWFTALYLDGVEYLTSAATYIPGDSPDDTVYSTWQWTGLGSLGIGSGTHPVVLSPAK
jgi:hypothetical protein